MNKTVFINGKFLTQRPTGVQRFAREIVSNLDDLSKPEELCLVIPKGKWNLPIYKNIKLKFISPFKGILWEQITLPLYTICRRTKCLNLCNVAPLIRPDFSTIHDTKIKTNPEYYSWLFKTWYKILFANQVRRCPRIFTVSLFAKKEIARNYPSINPSKIIVAYDAWQHYIKIEYDDYSLTKFNLKKNNYYFAMGSLEPNKNFKWVAEMAKKNPKFIFAVAGSINAKVFEEGLGFDCPQNMKLLGFISDEEAKTLMRDAKAFLFPSFSEGFGMPPLEALSAGCSRVIVSDIPVMHEIFEDNAIYINPNVYDYDLSVLLKNTKCDSESVLKRFSWKESAKIIYKIITNK